MDDRDEKRLQAFETMLADAIREQAELQAKMDRLRLQGKERSATFRQYMAQKLTCQNLLQRYRSYGLIH